MKKYSMISQMLTFWTNDFSFGFYYSIVIRSLTGTNNGINKLLPQSKTHVNTERRPSENMDLIFATISFSKGLVI